jgi:hypothetical protein
VSHRSTPLDILKKAAVLTLIGLAVVVMSGPIIALASVVLSVAVAILPFALVGFCAWSLYRIVIHGERPPWDHLGELGTWLGRMMGRFLQMGLRILAIPLLLGARLGVGVAQLVTAILGRTWSFAKAVGEIGVITATGVAVGGGVGVYLGLQHHDMDVAIPTNALMGGILACLAGITMMILERRNAVRRNPGLS